MSLMKVLSDIIILYDVLNWIIGKCEWVAYRGVFRMPHKFLLLAT